MYGYISSLEGKHRTTKTVHIFRFWFWYACQFVTNISVSTKNCRLLRILKCRLHMTAWSLSLSISKRDAFIAVILTHTIIYQTNSKSSTTVFHIDSSKNLLSKKLWFLSQGPWCNHQENVFKKTGIDLRFALLLKYVCVFLQELTQQAVSSCHPPPLRCRPTRPCELLWCPGNVAGGSWSSRHFDITTRRVYSFFHMAHCSASCGRANPIRAVRAGINLYRVPCVSVCLPNPDWLPWRSRGQNCRVRTALAMQPQACTSSNPETLHPQMKTWIHLSTMFDDLFTASLLPFSFLDA